MSNFIRANNIITKYENYICKSENFLETLKWNIENADSWCNPVGKSNHEDIKKLADIMIEELTGFELQEDFVPHRKDFRGNKKRISIEGLTYHPNLDNNGWYYYNSYIGTKTIPDEWKPYLYVAGKVFENNG